MNKLFGYVFGRQKESYDLEKELQRQIDRQTARVNYNIFSEPEEVTGKYYFDLRKDLQSKISQGIERNQRELSAGLTKWDIEMREKRKKLEEADNKRTYIVKVISDPNSVYQRKFSSEDYELAA